MEKRFPRLLLCAACIPWTEDYQLDVPLFRKGVGPSGNIFSLGATINVGGVKF